MAKKVISKILFYTFASLLALAALIPFFWMISTSLKARGALLAVPVQWIPVEPSLAAFKKVFTIFPFGRAIFNSAFLAVVITGVTILSAAMAAFAFTKIKFRGREGIFKAYLATMMVPFQVIIIPLFIVMSQMNLTNKFSGVILPAIFNSFAIFMLRQQMKSIPDDYVDAAVVDGASDFRIFFSVILPMCTTVIMTLVVMTFMGAWNDYLWPLIILTDKSKMTLPLALNTLNGQYSSEYNVLMAGSLISMLPIILVYLFAQKYFKSGLQVGGIKG